MKILVAEDDRKIASFLRKGFAQEGYVVEAVDNGEDAFAYASRMAFDVVVLDLLLPRMDGWTVIEKLRAARVKTPILVLSARGQLDDRVRGLQLGADDYLPKPFSFTELLARVRGIVRRSHGQPPGILEVADLTLDPGARMVKRGGERIDLTPREYALLEFLMRNADRVVTKNAIVEHVWGMNFDSFSNVVEVYVNYLRKKVDRDPARKLIHTVRGVGYVLRQEE